MPVSAPTRHCDCHISVQICSESQQLAGPYCPKESIVTKSFLVKDETGVTADTPYVISKDGSTKKCTVHNASSTAEPNEEDIKSKSEDSNTIKDPTKKQTKSSSKPQSNNTTTTVAKTIIPAPVSP